MSVLTLVLLGAVVLLAALVMLVDLPPERQTVILAGSVALASLSWLAFWPPVNDVFWNKLFVLPVVAGAVALILVPRGRSTGWAVTAMAGGMIGIAASGWHWGHDGIDVFVIMQRGALVLLHRHNPYQAWFPSTTVGIPRFHYDYGPLLLLLSVPAAWLGDVRLLGLLAAVAILVLGGRRLRGDSNRLELLLLLAVSPWLLWPVLQSWTELVAMALVLGWYELNKTWKLSWLLLAVALAVNPLVLLAVLPLLVVFPTLRALGVAGIGSGFSATYLPTGRDFVTAFRIASQQLSPHTIGLSGLFGLLTGRSLPLSVAVIVFLAGCGLAYLRPPQTESGRELAVVGITAVTVWCLPASYFEYVLIPMLWTWWWMITASSATTADPKLGPSLAPTARPASPAT